MPKSIQYFDDIKNPFELALNLYEYEMNHFNPEYTLADLSDAKKVRINVLKVALYKGEFVSQLQVFGTLISSQEKTDFIEFSVTLAKDDAFPLLQMKLKLNNPKMVALRFESPSMIGSSTQVFTSDSMFLTKRQHHDDNSVYPAVDGAAISRGSTVFWTVNSRTLGCRNLGKIYE